MTDESKPARKPAAKPVAKPAANSTAKTPAKPAAKATAKTPAKPAVKATAKTPAKPAPKTPAKPTTVTAAVKVPASPAAKATPAAKPVKPVKPAIVEEVYATTPTFSQSLSEAVRQSGFAQLKPGETPSAKVLLGAIGGIRGIVESIVPGIAFLAIYLPTRNLLIAVLVPAFIALLLVVIRAGAKSSMSSAVTGAVLLAVTAVLTLITGRAVNNFVPGILINTAGFIVMLGSILVRWPLVGLLVGLLFGDVDGWRKDAVKRRILTIATWFWVGLFAIRLAIEVPLYYADDVGALGVVRLITSVPLYAVCLWATWLLVRGVYAGDSSMDDAQADAHEN